eukprot:TRINITY_DN4604_c0_g1_i2.p1 TRINITY_DN4604_c0_g1~~TRINITY_DN4604_c0_g1_i2.p1  ORF type:complete len:421 (-),score=75.98 TRINITY_DN4604_c0_g1_i2:1437-2699(-)
MIPFEKFQEKYPLKESPDLVPNKIRFIDVKGMDNITVKVLCQVVETKQESAAIDMIPALNSIINESIRVYADQFFLGPKVYNLALRIDMQKDVRSPETCFCIVSLFIAMERALTSLKDELANNIKRILPQVDFENLSSAVMEKLDFIRRSNDLLFTFAPQRIFRDEDKKWKIFEPNHYESVLAVQFLTEYERDKDVFNRNDVMEVRFSAGLCLLHAACNLREHQLRAIRDHFDMRYDRARRREGEQLLIQKLSEASNRYYFKYSDLIVELLNANSLNKRLSVQNPILQRFEDYLEAKRNEERELQLRMQIINQIFDDAYDVGMYLYDLQPSKNLIKELSLDFSRIGSDLNNLHIETLVETIASLEKLERLSLVFKKCSVLSEESIGKIGDVLRDKDINNVHLEFLQSAVNQPSCDIAVAC